jgi:hypothetical protein
VRHPHFATFDREQRGRLFLSHEGEATP